MAVVYRHRRLDTNSIFYIGIGVKKERAYQKRSRNSLWENIISKTDYEVEIIAENVSYEDAKELEMFLISMYGRKDLSTGCLSNMTDGGDGNNNMSQLTKDKISMTLKGSKQSEETKNKRKNSLEKTWKSEELRALKRMQSTELNRLGLIGTRGMPSKERELN